MLLVQTWEEKKTAMLPSRGACRGFGKEFGKGLGQKSEESEGKTNIRNGMAKNCRKVV